ncbi:MAG: peptidase S1 [Gammaproteobacteria bacterium]
MLLSVLASNAAAQDASMNPNYGTLPLEGGFVPNPHNVSILAGGDMQASETLSGCVGWITRQPDFRLTYTANQYTGPLTVSVVASADSTLIIHTPNGQWQCNDDANGFNPSVTFQQPASGDYAIWIGSYVDEDVEGVLSFSETR